jgi:hypothetical protein
MSSFFPLFLFPPLQSLGPGGQRPKEEEEEEEEFIRIQRPKRPKTAHRFFIGPIVINVGQTRRRRSLSDRDRDRQSRGCRRRRRRRRSLFVFSGYYRGTQGARC